MKQYNTILKILVLFLIIAVVIYSGCQKPLSDIIIVDEGSALKKDGTVWAWGLNYVGQLGNGKVEAMPKIDFIKPNFSTLTRYYLSNKVLGHNGTGYLSDIIAISTRLDYRMALRKDGTIWTWGHSCNGVLGNNKIPMGFGNGSSIPIQVQGLNNVIAISAGECFCITLKNDDTVWVWGSGWSVPLRSRDKTAFIETNKPIQIIGLSDIIAIAAGCDHALALKKDGTVWGWGDGRSGGLGDKTLSIKDFPIQVQGLENVSAISAGVGSSFAIKKDGTVWGWGSGITTFDDITDYKANKLVQLFPIVQQIPSLTNVKSISCGIEQIAVLKNDGTLWKTYYTPFVNRNKSTPGYPNISLETKEPCLPTFTQMSGLINVKMIADGGRIILKEDGTVWQLEEDPKTSKWIQILVK